MIKSRIIFRYLIKENIFSFLIVFLFSCILFISIDLIELIRRSSSKEIEFIVADIMNIDYDNIEEYLNKNLFYDLTLILGNNYITLPSYKKAKVVSIRTSSCASAVSKPFSNVSSNFSNFLILFSSSLANSSN